MSAADLAKQLDAFATRIEATRLRVQGRGGVAALAGVEWDKEADFATFNMNDEWSSDDKLRTAQLAEVRKFWERLFPKPWFEANVNDE